MPLTVDGFLKQLSDSGILSETEISSVEAQIPVEKRSKDAQSLAKELVRLKKLTLFQANLLYNDRASSLVLGNYVLLDKIGVGGMGVVYKAHHRRMKRIVAIKVLSAKATQSPHVVKRFLREAEAAAKLSHPNIVAAYDADEVNGVPFLAMEFVSGTDLAIHVHEHGTLLIEKAIDCILQAARGLEHAHSQGIVHRDIKPANMLLDVHGTVKILDMGLARFDDLGKAHSIAEAAAITQAGNIVGTVDFMSPEQAFDSSSADALSDIYSLGATFYYLLTGRAMFEAESLMSRLLAHRESERPSICQNRPDAPGQLETIFQRMTARHRDDRYPSMSEVIRDLSNWKNVVESGKQTHPTDTVPQSVINMIFEDD